MDVISYLHLKIIFISTSGDHVPGVTSETIALHHLVDRCDHYTILCSKACLLNTFSIVLPKIASILKVHSRMRNNFNTRTPPSYIFPSKNTLTRELPFSFYFYLKVQAWPSGQDLNIPL